ncbi:class B sortase [Hungatella hathewayi]|uniref:class B sortase n=1 Tax=Hungatella hathewayi TaxID=154046 RepID=UPI003565CD1A
MKKYIIKTIIAILIFICLAIVIQYVSSITISTKKYNDLKKEVVMEKNVPIEALSSATKETQDVVITTEQPKETDTNHQVETNISEETSPQEATIEETKEIVARLETVTEYASLSQYMNHIPVLEIDHSALSAINSDYKGWLNIPDTNISYPVPQGPDNDFYLHKLFENKQYEYAGSLFIDAYSAKMVNQDNLIIYGHNMKNGSMFGRLKKFKTKSYFDSHPYIEFYTPDEKRVYLIFSVRTVSSNINNLEYALEGFDVQDYISKAGSVSEQSRNIDTNKNGFENSPYKQIITLSTCVGDTSKRLIINGIRIK